MLEPTPPAALAPGTALFLSLLCAFLAPLVISEWQVFAGIDTYSKSDIINRSLVAMLWSLPSILLVVIASMRYRSFGYRQFLVFGLALIAFAIAIVLLTPERAGKIIFTMIAQCVLAVGLFLILFYMFFDRNQQS